MAQKNSIFSFFIIFIKFYFKAYWLWTYIQKKLACKVSYILSYLFVLQMKKDQNFSGVLPQNPHQGSAMNQLRSLQHLKTPTCILQHSKIQ